MRVLLRESWRSPSSREGKIEGKAQETDQVRMEQSAKCSIFFYKKKAIFVCIILLRMSKNITCLETSYMISYLHPLSHKIIPGNIQLHQKR